MGALNGNSGFGFFGFLVAFGVGALMAEVVTRTSGYYRGRESGAIAAGGSLLAYVVAWQAVPMLDAHTRLAPQLGHAAVRVRRRRRRRRLPPGRSDGRRSRLRRARRVVAGGLVGGAVVMLDRRRRQARAAAPLRGSDPLAAFTDAPCYREAAAVRRGLKSG